MRESRIRGKVRRAGARDPGVSFLGRYWFIVHFSYTTFFFLTSVKERVVLTGKMSFSYASFYSHASSDRNSMFVSHNLRFNSRHNQSLQPNPLLPFVRILTRDCK